ncbi:hypothetical protein [Methanobrevibacter sp. DSM 116169]|uniref:hypothetical protein n=1 Tax=Methanobrevibacter sp. DSM 116169 TaxID=3242727 RepID=UPI0038FC0F42
MVNLKTNIETKNYIKKTTNKNLNYPTNSNKLNSDFSKNTDKIIYKGELIDTIDFIAEQLNKITINYGLNQVIFSTEYNQIENSFDKIFYIKVPNDITISKKHEIWDNIIDDIEKLCKNNNCYDTLLKLFIILN